MSNKIKSNQNEFSFLLVANYKSDVGYAWWLMENFWVEISKYFNKRNLKSVLIYPKITKIPKIVSNAPIKIIEHNFSDRSFKGLLSLRKIVKQERVKVIYLTDRKLYDWLYFVLRIWGVRIIINHFHWVEGIRTPPFYRKIYLKHFYKNKLLSCDTYIGVSKCVKEALTLRCVPENKCVYIHNGIQPIEDVNNTNQYVNKLFNIPTNSIIVVTVGRATFYKGHDIYVECANYVINILKESNVYFLHIGSGPDLTSFQKLSKKYNLEHKLIFAGHRNDVREILPSCHIAVQLSKGEAFSLAILEYMSAGLATIAQNHYGNPEAIVHNYTGILFEKRDYREVSSIIQFLIKNPSVRKKLGTNAKKSVIERFNIKNTNRELMELLSEKIDDLCH